MQTEIFTNLLIFLVAAVIVVPLFRWFRSSSILGYLTAGLLIGPYCLGLVKGTESINALAEFGVVFLLFKIGLELTIERLRLLKRYVFGLGSAQVILTGLLIGLIAHMAGMSPAASIVIGGGLALSSTAFVMQLLAERHEQTTRFGLVSFAVLLFQDIAVVPFLALIPLLGQGETSVISALEIAAFKTALVLVAILIFGRVFLRPIYRIIAGTKSPELFVAATLLIVLGTSWAMHEVGLSMALGAFLAGSLLAETEYRHQVEADIRPFKGILLGLFFMAIGMSINIPIIQERALWIILLVIGLLVLKASLLFLICLAMKLSIKVAIRVGLLLSQGGEFGFVLFGAANKSQVLDDPTTQTLLAAITLSMVVTPLCVYIGQRITNAITKRSKKYSSNLDLEHKDLNEHVLIAGFGRVGQAVAKVLSVSGVPYIALDLDHSRVAKCRAKEMPVFYGDSSRLEVLRAAGAAKAKAAVITISQANPSTIIVAALRENFPDLKIFVRAKDRKHGLSLENSGATDVVPEASESSLQLGAIVLKAMGTGADEVHHVIDEFRQNDYEKLEDTILGYDEK